MSLTASLNNALSGLTVATKRTQIISSNLSNAMTEGYVRRSLEVTSRSNGSAGGAGVSIVGIQRKVDSRLLSDRRIADGDLSAAITRANALVTVENAIGLPGDVGSLNERIAAFEGALIDAGARPDSTAYLEAVSYSAERLALGINDVADAIQTERERADADIAIAVDTLNTALEQVAVLNEQIAVNNGKGRDTTVMQDQRQRVIDTIAEIVPIREVPEEQGRVSLFSLGGETLLESSPAVFEFSPAGAITPFQSLGAGTLSGLTLDGDPVAPSGSLSPVEGGRLSALFVVRDETMPAAQAQIDAIARDLVERFADPAVDPTLGAADPGLFTDAGAAFATANETGLAQRISVNALVDPSTGGSWRIRDGLGALVAGEVGNASIINALNQALTEGRVPASGGFSGSAVSVSGLASEFLSRIGVDRQTADAYTSFAAARQTTLLELELEGGVDSDQELQDLLLVEQAYAANARVIQVIDEMMRSILEL